MTLQKRDCPIKIRAYPTGSQFSCVEFDIHGDHFRFAPSAALGCPGAAVAAPREKLPQLLLVLRLL